MVVILKLLVGASTLGLPIWFAILDRKAFPRLKWIGEGEPIPRWGHTIVIVGILLAVLIAVVSPISGPDPGH